MPNRRPVIAKMFGSVHAIDDNGRIVKRWGIQPVPRDYSKRRLTMAGAFIHPNRARILNKYFQFDDMK